MSVPAGPTWNLPTIRGGFAAPAELVESRSAVRALEAIQIADPGIPVRQSRLGGVACVEAGTPEAGATLLFLHGGGYRMGEARTWAAFATRLAAAAGARVVVPDYRLAPEHPFPGGLHDARAVYSALCEAEGAPPFVGGDSAGGGLACSLVLAAIAAGTPLPAGVILVSPWLDLVPSAGSFERCADSDAAFSAEAARLAADQYLQGESPEHPLLSPLRADLSEFPPCWIAASAGEVLVDQSLALAERLTNARRPNSLHIEPDMPHAWPMIVPGAPETAATIAGVAAFIRHYGRGQTDVGQFREARKAE